MTTQLTEGTLRQIADHSVHPENRIMAAELLAKREECEALLASVKALLAASEKLLAERDAANQRTANMLAKLREDLGADLGCGGGFVEILNGIDGLREQRDAARAEAEKLRAYTPQPFDASLPTYASVLRTLHETEAELDAVKRQRDESNVKMGELATWARKHSKNSERWETYQLEVWRVVATEIGSAIKMLAIYSQPAQQPKPEVQP